LPITHPQHGENWMWAFDNPEFRDVYDLVGTERVWELYMEILLDAIDKLPGHIVGHFYVPAKFGHWPDDAVLETYEDRLIDACAERGMAVEINSRYLYKYFSGDDAQTEKYRTVHLRLMRKAKAKGVMIAVGSDAHSPRDQGGGFEAVLALLDEAEINEIAFPLGDRLARVALRATEDILRQHSAALAALAAPPPAPARGFMPADPADDDDEAGDGEDVQAEVRVEPRPEMTRTEMRHDGAELILPPGAGREAAQITRESREGTLWRSRPRRGAERRRCRGGPRRVAGSARDGGSRGAPGNGRRSASRARRAVRASRRCHNRTGRADGGDRRRRAAGGPGPQSAPGARRDGRARRRAFTQACLDRREAGEEDRADGEIRAARQARQEGAREERAAKENFGEEIAGEEGRHAGDIVEEGDGGEGRRKKTGRQEGGAEKGRPCQTQRAGAESRREATHRKTPHREKGREEEIDPALKLAGHGCVVQNGMRTDGIFRT
jgi:hypothetical protein